MKEILRKLLAISLCAALIGGTAVSLPVFVPDSSITADAAYTSRDYEYEIENNNATITKYNGSSGKVTIPSKIDGYPVTSIGDWAFEDCSILKSVTIPDSVTSIGNCAFSQCSSLTSVTIPNSVTSIGDWAFEDCSSLKSVTIPDSVTRIGSSAFRDCSSLTSVTIPDSVTIISSSAFRDCRRLTSVTIPDSVTSIGEDAFRGCSRLTSVTIPDSVTSIGGCAFSDCSRLTSVTIPESVTEIGWSAFLGCISLTSVTIPYGVTTIEEGAFSHCSSLTSVTIPDSVTRIGYWAFEDCSSLTSVTIPDSVTRIGGSAFYGCRSLTSVTIPDSVTSIGNWAFGYYDDGYNKIDGFTIYGEKGTAAEEYANDNGFKFVVKLDNTSVINSDIVQIGDKVRVSASAKGGTGGYKYAYYYKRSTNTAWNTLGTEWGTNSSAAFAPTAEASYDIKVVVKDSAGQTAEKLFTVKAVKGLALTNVSVVGRTSVKLGTAIPMIGKAVGGKGDYRYSFYFKRSTNTNWKLLGDKFTDKASARFKPTAKGTYDIRIDVMDKSGKVVKKFFTATVK